LQTGDCVLGINIQKIPKGSVFGRDRASRFGNVASLVQEVESIQGFYSRDMIAEA
jgi:hypothetical protein